MGVAVCRKRESYLEFGIRVGMRKIRRNIVRQKNMLREQYILLWIRKLERQQRRLICIVAVVSCLELPHKGLGRRKMLLGLVVLKMKEHVDKLMNVENEWSDSIDASKVEGAVRRMEVEKVWFAMNSMKIGKASWPSGVAIELFMAGGDKCFKIFDMFNDILFKLPEE